MKKTNYIMCLALAAMLASCQGGYKYKYTTAVDETPNIWPDYKEVTIPYEIAPLNFNFTGYAYHWLALNIKGSISGEINVEGKHVDIDIDEWHKLTEANKGGQLMMRLSVMYDDRRTDFKEFPIYVSGDPLDEYGLTYRLVEPGYVGFSKMGIYQRNLSNYDEDAIFETTASTNSCVNCHTPNRTNSNQATFHVRGDNGFTLVRDNGNVHAYNLKTDQTISGGVYPYWHHTGKYIAYSNNKTFQVFHSAHKNKIEVFDMNSDLMIFDMEKQEVVLSPQIMKDSIAETFPAFSPDGKTLYYCQANKAGVDQYLEELKYCLMRVPFDEATGHVVGKPDTLLAIEDKSITLPRPSYDGKYLMFTLADYGTFPIWHHEADLYMLDLQNKDSLILYPAEELNSSDTESFHNWSANSKWLVFSSRREDGLYTRLYLAHVNDNGTFSKPFILPQKNPVRYYNDLFYSYNTPDFCDKPFDISPIELRRIANSHERESVKAR